jgi:hypothetical protein
MAALESRIKIKPMQTNNEGWMMHTPQSFTQIPVRIHKSKRKELFTGIKMPRKRAKVISKPEFRSGQRESCLQILLTGHIQRTTTLLISVPKQ